MSDRLRIYIAGPYTHGDVAVNVHRAMLAGMSILDAGHLPFIPHLNHFLHMSYLRPYEAWLQFDLSWLTACHAVLRLDGHSPGADREVERAKQLGLTIYDSLSACLEALPPRREEERG